MDFPTQDELFLIGETEALARNSLITRDAAERAGTDVNALLAAPAAVGDECIGQLIQVQSGLFLSSAENAQLDQWVWDRYQILRKPASPAMVQVAFTSSTPLVSGLTIDIGTVLQTNDAKLFALTTPAYFPVGSLGPVTANAQSVLSGASQQIRSGTLTTITTAIEGATPTLAVTNLLASAGAGDEETSDAFRSRVRNFYSTTARGTLSAIEQAALGVPGVIGATAFEVTESNGIPARLVQLVVATSFTSQIIDTMTAPTTYPVQSNAINAQIQNALDNVRGCGIQVLVTLAEVVLQGVVLVLSFVAGADTQSVAAQSSAAVVSYINELAPGETLSVSTLTTLIEQTSGLVPTGHEIYAPSGDVVPTILQVIRTTSSLVSIGISP